jgi:hypothetical protein
MALAQAFEAVRQHPWGKRDADSHLARTVTNGRGGFNFHAVRLLVRAYRLSQRVRAWLGLRQSVPSQAAEAERSLC